MERNIPNITEQNAEFIGRILHEKNPKNILEIGTANGYSALSFVYFLSKFSEEKHIEKHEDEGKKSCKLLDKIAKLERENSKNSEENQYSNALSMTENCEKNFSENKLLNLPKIFTIEFAWNAHNEAVEHFKNCKTKNIFPIWGDAKAIIPVFQNDFFDVIYIDAMKKEYLEYFRLSLPKAKDDAIFIIDDVEKFRDKMEDFYEYLEHQNIAYRLEKTDEDDSIMIIHKKDILSI